MNKIKELWGKNKVMIVLFFILLLCVIAITMITITFFFGSDKSADGGRTEKNSQHPLTESFKSEYISSLTEDKKIKSAKIDLTTRTIYITIEFVGDVPLVDAESKAEKSLAKIDEDLLNYYDINFILKSEATENSEGFTMFGAKNVAGTTLKWSNNTPIESEE